MPALEITPASSRLCAPFSQTTWIIPFVVDDKTGAGNQSAIIHLDRVIGTTPTGSSEEFNIINQSVNCTAINNPVKRSTGVDDTTLAMMKKIESFIPKDKLHRSHISISSLPSFLLNMDLFDRIKCVNANTGPRVILNDNQFGVLSSFVFNAGCDALTTSTRLNNGEDPNTGIAQV
ncbi:hypothetical protein C8J57DRAFT_1617939 [Mycena rebaudengoi]|nr:hypothetical protein C8J57DRAFT_1617939 [Mycena rebaudengoi]